MSYPEPQLMSLKERLTKFLDKNLFSIPDSKKPKSKREFDKLMDTLAFDMAQEFSTSELKELQTFLMEMTSKFYWSLEQD